MDLTEPERIVVLKKEGITGEQALEALAGYGWEVESLLLAEDGSVHGDTVYLCARKK